MVGKVEPKVRVREWNALCRIPADPTRVHHDKGLRTESRRVLDCRGFTRALPNVLACAGQEAPIINKDSPIVFLHIPKASGTSMESLLQRYVKALNRTARAVSMHRLIDLDQSVAHVRPVPTLLYMSKRTASLEDELMTPRIFMVTILRHPAERLLSHYRYLKSHRQYLPGKCTSHGRNFSTWFTRYFHEIPDLNNFEVRLLLGRGEAPQVANTADTVCQMQPRTCSFVREPERQLPRITAAHARTAAQRLSRMSFIGLTERFDETVLLLNAILPGFHAARNGRPQRLCGDQPTCVTESTASATADRASFEEVRPRVERDNWASMLLWSQALRLFDAQSRAAQRPCCRWQERCVPRCL